jgi:hypothetical protein
MTKSLHEISANSVAVSAGKKYTRGAVESSALQRNWEAKDALDVGLFLFYT